MVITLDEIKNLRLKDFVNYMANIKQSDKFDMQIKDFRDLLLDKYKESNNAKVCTSETNVKYCVITQESSKNTYRILCGSILRDESEISSLSAYNVSRSPKSGRDQGITDGVCVKIKIRHKNVYVDKLLYTKDDTNYRSKTKIVKMATGSSAGSTYLYDINNDKKDVEATVKFAEKSGESDKTESANHAESAYKLSEEGILELENRVIERYKEEKQREKEETLKYKYVPYLTESQSFNLHSDDALEKLHRNLCKVHRAIIVAPSGAGKTALANYYIADKFGYNIGTNSTAYENVLFINGRSSVTLLGTKDNPGILIKFIRHIVANNIKGPYVIIYNEAQNGIDSELEEIWDIWNKTTWYGRFQTHYGEIVELLKDMYWMFTACSEDENVMDRQVINRLSGQLGIVELGYVSNSDLYWMDKLINNLSEHYRMDKNTIDTLVTSIARINDSDRSQVISLGNILNTIENKDITFVTDNIPKDLITNSLVKKEAKTIHGVIL